MDKKNAHQQEQLGVTVGGQMLSFGRQKIRSVMKRFSPLIRENKAAQSVGIANPKSLQFSRELSQKRNGLALFMRKRFSHELQLGDANAMRLAYESTKRKPMLQPFDFIKLFSGKDNQDVAKQRSRNELNSKPLPDQQLESHQREDKGPERGMMLPRPLLNVYSRLLGMRLPPVTVHQDQASDEFLTKHRADAMTMGTNIYFKTGKFDLGRSRGLGLLGHELTHVAQQYGREAVRGVSREAHEKTALANERMVYANASTPGMKNAVANSISHIPSPQVAFPATQAAKRPAPLFAESSREINDFLPLPPQRTAATLSENDMMKIKEELYRDLMQRIKVDFERGG